jgi:hypothetical protein
MDLYRILLMIHVFSGAVSLLTAAIAIAAKNFGWQHRIHLTSGKVFSLAMALIFVTALPMSLMKLNIFLLLVSIFSFYLMLMGWLYATDRQGKVAPIMLGVSSIMILTSLAMLGYGIWQLMLDRFALPLIAFGAIGLFLAWIDWRVARAGGLKGKPRIAQHLTQMMGATIAAITAFLVNVVQLEGFLSAVLWLAPTAILVPMLIRSARSVQA